MGRLVVGGRARGIAEGEERRQRPLEVTPVEARVGVAARLVVGPGAGEAVGLQLLVDPGLVVVAGTVLDGVTPLVRQDQRDREVAVLAVELREQLDVVVDDEVVVEAVEGVPGGVPVAEPVALGRSGASRRGRAAITRAGGTG